MKLFNLFAVYSLLIAKILANSLSCSTVTKKYENCIANFNTVDFDAMCNAYASAKCQDLFNRPKEILKGCDSEFIEKTTKVFAEMTNVLKYTCARDEYGHYCSLSTIIQTTQKNQRSSGSVSSKNLSETFSSLKDSCSSKNCLKVSVSYLKSIKTMASKNSNVSKNDIKDIESLITQLYQCSTGASSSSSSSTKSSSSSSSSINNNKKEKSITISDSVSHVSDDNEISTSNDNSNDGDNIENNNVNIENNNVVVDTDTSGTKSTIDSVPVGDTTIDVNQDNTSIDINQGNSTIEENPDNTTIEENKVTNSHINSVSVGDDAQGNISDDITIYDQYGNAVGSSSGLVQNTSDSESKINLSIAIIILTIIVNIIF